MQVSRLRFSKAAYLLIGCAAVLTVLPYGEALSKFIDVWNLQPEYSHGVLIPFLSSWLVWRQRAVLRALPFTGSWSGLWLIAIGAFLALIGDLATIWWIVQYGFLFALYGMVLCLTGGAVFRRLWIPLLILVFMIPLPAFFGNTLSLQLQLLSSQIGVWIIRTAGISVFLEGNVIDLGAMQLQVAEACDGLRYLFPLMTLAFVMAYLFQASTTRKLLLFFASIPIAILMNSLRIGGIGITVEYWGRRMAEGVLHEFEGWVVFMLSTATLLGVAALMKPRGTSLRDAFNPPEPRVAKAATAEPPRQSLPRPFIGATALVALAAALHFMLPSRIEIAPARAALDEFPTQLGSWHGERGVLERVYLDTLQLDDYLMANYRRAPAAAPLNFYVAWYGSQRSGRSVHSPRACIPGGGWVITSLEKRELDVAGTAVPVNRAVVELGGTRQIIYYWFQQRGRRLNSEYLVKWYILWDALTRNRSDGALVRLSVPVHGAGGEAEADRSVAQFAAAALPLLTRYVPD